MIHPIIYYKNFKIRSYLARIEQEATDYLDHYGLLPVIKKASEQTGSVGASHFDYAFLHSYVREKKPQYFLECGTGLSTHVIARAMKEFCYERYNGDIKLVSMEDHEGWYEKAIKHKPEGFDDFLQIKLSPKDHYQHSFIRGIIYKEIPEYQYDTVFVDGPNLYDGMCNMDFVKLVNSSDIPITAIIDGRKPNVLAYSYIYGKDKLNFHSDRLFGVDSVTKKDEKLMKKYSKIFNENLPFDLITPVDLKY